MSKSKKKQDQDTDVPVMTVQFKKWLETMKLIKMRYDAQQYMKRLNAWYAFPCFRHRATMYDWLISSRNNRINQKNSCGYWKWLDPKEVPGRYYTPIQKRKREQFFSNEY